MDKEATEKIITGLQCYRDSGCDNAEGVNCAYLIMDELKELGYDRVICPECGHIRDEDRVRNGMKCSYCAGYGGK